MDNLPATLPISNGSRRRMLPARRCSWTQKVLLNGTACYLTCGEYQGGDLGEIFVVISKKGSDLRAMLESFARNFSIALQYGTPLEVLIKTHRGIDFNPQGTVSHDCDGSLVIRASSVIDWVCQELENTYLKEQSS